MTKKILKLKNSVLTSRFYMLPSYLMFVGLCFRALALQMPVALADQQDSVNDYSLLAVEAIQIPDLSSQWKYLDEIRMIFQGNSFAQALYSFGSVQEEKTLLELEEVSVPVVETLIQVVQKLDRVIVTAYSSTPDQTDSSPFITANGAYVYDGLVACNFLPFGAKVRFPDYFGDKIFTVEDRMAKHNSHKIDVWMPDRQSALNFGVRTLAVEVVR